MTPGKGQRLFGTALVLLCAVGILSLVAAAPASSATDPEEELNVSATVDDDTVWTGQTVDVTVTVTTTINETYYIDDATLVDGDGEVRAERDLFNFRVSEDNVRKAMTFEDVSVDEPGITEFQAVLSVEDHIGRAVGTIKAPVSVTVSNPDPVADLTAEPALNGTDRTLSLTVGNPHNTSIRRIEASLEKPADAPFEITSSREVIPSLEPSAARELRYPVRDATTGTYEFNVSLKFETEDGEYWETTSSHRVEFLEPSESVQVGVAEVSVRAAPNGVRLNGSLFTEGNVSTENVQITTADEQGVGPARPEPQAYISSVGGRATGGFELTASLSEERAQIPLRIRYQIDGVKHTTTVEVPYSGPRNVPPVQLTSVNIAGGETVRIDGELANTREVPVTGVTARILDREGVSPGDPGEFYAGSIESGKFTPLESLSAEVTGPSDSIPVELSYVYKGTQYTTVVELDHSAGGQSGTTPGGGQGADSSLPEFDPGADKGSGGGSLPGSLPALVGGALVVVAVLLGAVVYRRR